MHSVLAAVLVLALNASSVVDTMPPEKSAPEKSGPDTPVADKPAAAWDVQQLMQGLAQVKSAKRKFTERKYMSVLTTPLESSGTLVYKAPGRLEKHTLLPRDESMVLDYGTVTIENKAKNQRRTLMLHDYPAIGAFVESIRSTLAGDLRALTQFYQVKLEGESEHWRLQLLPNDAATRQVVREIRIAGHGNWVGSVEVIEASGDRSVMTVTEEVQ